MTLGLYSEIEEVLKQNTQKVLIKTLDGDTLTRAEVLHKVDVMASILADLKVAAGDRVSVQVDKDPLNVILYLAVLKVGAAYLPLNSGYTDAEIDYFLSDAEPALHVCTSSRFDGALKVASKLPQTEVRTLDLDGGTLRELFDKGRAGFGKAVARTDSDLASILYTSGTTGKPKGAMLSQQNLLANAKMLTQAWQYSENDTLVHALPLFHVHGLFVALNLALLNGGTILLLPKYDVDAILSALPEASVMMGVPTYYTRLLADPRFNKDLAGHMRLFISGSAPLLVETSDAFFERTGQRILERYGMTETGMSCSNPLDGERRAGSVGPALPGVEARVMLESGAIATADEIGALQVRGEHVFQGYWKLPEKTASEFTQDGFFITGDLATCSSDGYISIVGRDKDLIITGGLNVYPKEIEDLLNQQAGVIESAVVGVEHPDFGEGIVAAVVCSEDIDFGALEAQCRETLAAFKVPRRWYRMSELPRNTMGKVQKNLLRAEFSNAYR